MGQVGLKIVSEGVLDRLVAMMLRRGREDVVAKLLKTLKNRLGARLGAVLARLGPSWGVLGPSWGSLGTLWGVLGGVPGGSWRGPGRVLGRSRGGLFRDVKIS